MQQINFTGKLRTAENTIMTFIIKEKEETVLHFLKSTVKVL